MPSMQTHMHIRPLCCIHCMARACVSWKRSSLFSIKVYLSMLATRCACRALVAKSHAQNGEYSPLTMACRWHRLDIAKFLIESKADIDQKAKVCLARH